MAAPVVTRPAAVEEQTTSGFPAEEAAQWAKWAIIASVVLGLIGLVAAAAVTINTRQQTAAARQNWDEVYGALKDKKRPEERIAALESVASKVSGSTAHAYVLMELGDLYFDQAISPTKSPEEQSAALKKSTDLYKLVATNEPYASNPAFGPVAVENLATAMEQAKDYDGAINFLLENVKKWETHFLYNKMSAQLGRLYWLRSQTREKDEDREKDREAAREKLSEVLRGAADDFGKWREQASYIKSLVDKRGKLLPEGTPIPAAKAPPAPPTPPVGAVPPQIKIEKNAKPAPGAKKEQPAKVEPKKVDQKKDAPKTDEKKDAKKDDKKTDNSDSKTEQPQKAALSTTEHVSFSQIQQMLKEGKTSFCQCPRCDTGAAKEASARLIE